MCLSVCVYYCLGGQTHGLTDLLLLSNSLSLSECIVIFHSGESCANDWMTDIYLLLPPPTHVIVVAAIAECFYLTRTKQIQPQHTVTAHSADDDDDDERPTNQPTIIATPATTQKENGT